MHKLLFKCIKEAAIMRTTLDLPEELINKAMKASMIRTKTKVIITALEELVRKSQLSGLKEFKGKIDLDMDIDALRDRKCRS